MNKDPKKVEVVIEETPDKKGFDHFMMKEIYDQPEVIAETLETRLDENGEVVLDGINLTKEDIEGYNKIYIVACGTAYHAGLVGKIAIEKWAGIPVEVEISSEFKYRDPVVDEKTLVITVTQSGETIDTLGALRVAKEKGARVLSVVNVVGSTVAKESDDVFYTWAGPEIAVPSTKGYTTQLVCMYLIGLYMARKKGSISEGYYREVIAELKEMPEKVKKILEKSDDIAAVAEKIYSGDSFFFVGRGPDCGVAFEGSLKLKETSYINSIAIASGEIKHGTMALVTNEAVIFALSTQDHVLDKMQMNVEEFRSKGAFVIAIAKEGDTAVGNAATECVYIPKCMSLLSPILTIVPLQIFAYNIAKGRGCNVDEPRNLTKAVVEE